MAADLQGMSNAHRTLQHIQHTHVAIANRLPPHVPWAGMRVVHRKHEQLLDAASGTPHNLASHSNLSAIVSECVMTCMLLFV